MGKTIYRLDQTVPAHITVTKMLIKLLTVTATVNVTASYALALVGN
jgi:hypothetical protein